MGHPQLSSLLRDLRDHRRCPPAVVVFDIDSTLLSTAARQLQILQEWLDEKGRADLRAALGDLLLEDMGWDLRDNLRAAGLEEPSLLADVQSFWSPRFFDGDYLRHDQPIAGAVDFVQRCHEAGALVYYLTARDAPGMGVATVRSLSGWGFPLWTGRCVLHLKADAGVSDREHKSAAMASIRSHGGEVVATFDNDPGHANRFCREFPEGRSFLLDTVRAPDGETPLPQLLWTTDFSLD